MTASAIKFSLFTVACRQQTAKEFEKISRQLRNIEVFLKNRTIGPSAIGSSAVKAASSSGSPRILRFARSVNDKMYLSELPLANISDLKSFENRLKNETNLRHRYVSPILILCSSLSLFSLRFEILGIAMLRITLFSLRAYLGTMVFMFFEISGAHDTSYWWRKCRKAFKIRSYEYFFERSKVRNLLERSKGSLRSAKYFIGEHDSRYE